MFERGRKGDRETEVVMIEQIRRGKARDGCIAVDHAGKSAAKKGLSAAWSPAVMIASIAAGIVHHNDWILILCIRRFSEARKLATRWAKVTMCARRYVHLVNAAHYPYSEVAPSLIDKDFMNHSCFI